MLSVRLSSMKPAVMRELLAKEATVPEKSWKAMASPEKLSTLARIRPLFVTEPILAPASIRTP